MVQKTGERLIGLIGGGQEEALELVSGHLAPAADYFASEPFSQSDMTSVEQSKTFEYDLDDLILHISFTASKLGPIGETAQRFACYNVTIARQTMWQEGDYWPPEQVYEDVEFLSEDGLRYVREVRSFMIDDEYFAPVKDTHWEYLELDEDGDYEVVGHHSFEDPVFEDEPMASEISDDIPDEVRLMGQLMIRSFYEDDLEKIFEVLFRLGYSAESCGETEVIQ